MTGYSQRVQRAFVEQRAVGNHHQRLETGEGVKQDLPTGSDGRYARAVAAGEVTALQDDAIIGEGRSQLGDLVEARETVRLQGRTDDSV